MSMELMAGLARVLLEASVDVRHWPAAIRLTREAISGSRVIVDVSGDCEARFRLADPTRMPDGVPPGCEFDDLVETAVKVRGRAAGSFGDPFAPGILTPLGRCGTAAHSGTCSCFAAALQPGGCSRGLLAVCWYCRSSGSQRLGVQRSRLVLPLLEGALANRRRVSTLRTRLAAIERVLDRLPTAVMLVDRSTVVHCTNRKGDGLLRDGDGFALDGNRLLLGRATDQKRFRRMVRAQIEAGLHGQRPRPAAMAVPRPSGRRAYGVAVTAPDPAWSSPAASAAVFVSDPERPVCLSVTCLRRLFGLTRTEARVAAGLAHGLALTEVAAQLGIATGTARVHLKHLFSKTGTHRQSELVSVLLCSCAYVVQDSTSGNGPPPTGWSRTPSLR